MENNSNEEKSIDEPMAKRRGMDIDEVSDSNNNNAADENVQRPNDTALVRFDQSQTYFSLLNDDQLLPIFEDLYFYGLLQMSEIDPRYLRIISQEIVPKRTLVFSEICPFYSVRQAFRMFGYNAAHIDFKAVDIQYKKDKYNHLEEMLRLIKKRCSSKNLKLLKLTFSFQEMSASRLDKFVPIFRKLESLHLDGSVSHINFAAQDVFLEKVFATCANLRVLQMKEIFTSGKWLRSTNLNNLDSLEFISCYFTGASLDHWNWFLRADARPLKSLQWIDSKLPDNTYFNICNRIVMAFPGLVELSIQMQRQLVFLPVTRLSNLKALKITVDLASANIILYNFLTHLAAQNTVEKLSIRILDNDIVDDIPLNRLTASQAFERFTSLRFVEIENPTRRSVDLVKVLLYRLPRSYECSLISERPILQEIIKDVANSPGDLTVLKIMAPPTNFSQTFYASLVSDRMRLRYDSHCLHIFLKLSQLRFPINAGNHNQRYVRLRALN